MKSALLGLRIVCMTDAGAALNGCVNKQVDLIITDYRMQQMDGIHFVMPYRVQVQ